MESHKFHLVQFASGTVHFFRVHMYLHEMDGFICKLHQMKLMRPRILRRGAWVRVGGLTINYRAGLGFSKPGHGSGRNLGVRQFFFVNGRPVDMPKAAAMFKVLKETPPIPENLSEEGKDLLRCCFRRNPAERASASMCYWNTSSHPLDVLSCSVSLSGMKLRDDANSQRERLNSKLDQVPAYSDMHIAKRKLSDNYIHGSLAPVRLANDVTTKL